MYCDDDDDDNDDDDVDDDEYEYVCLRVTMNSFLIVRAW